MRLLVVGDASSVNVQQWCEGLASAGVDVAVLSFAPAWSSEIHVVQLPGWTDRGPLRYHLAAPAARRAAAVLAPDVVVGYFATGYGTLARHLGHPRLVLAVVGSDVLQSPDRPLPRIMLRRNLRRARLTVAWAPHLASAAEALGAPPSRTATLCQGIRVGHFSALRKERLGVERRRIITTRSLTPFYRTDLLLRAVARAEPRPERLTIAGDGPSRHALEELAVKLGIESVVHFVGTVPQAVLPSLLAEHGVYASLAPTDGSSASLMEAMATGLVPVAVDNPANRAWIRAGRNGILLSSDSDEAVAVALSTAMTDPGLLEGRAENLCAVASRADLGTNVRRFLDLLEQLL